jgi:hypothetical protein
VRYLQKKEDRCAYGERVQRTEEGAAEFSATLKTAWICQLENRTHSSLRPTIARAKMENMLVSDDSVSQCHQKRVAHEEAG